MELVLHALDAEDIFHAVRVVRLAGRVVGRIEREDPAGDHFLGLVVGFLVTAGILDGIAGLRQVHLGQEGLDGAFRDTSGLVMPRHAGAFSQGFGVLQVGDDLSQHLRSGGQRHLRVVESGGRRGLERHGTVVADEPAIVKAAQEIHFGQILVALRRRDFDVFLVLKDVDHRIDVVEAVVEGAPGRSDQPVGAGDVAVEDLGEIGERVGGTLGIAAEEFAHHDYLGAADARAVQGHADAEVSAVGAHAHLLLIGIEVAGLFEGLRLLLEEIRARYSQNQCGCDCHDFIKISFHRAQRFRM